MRTLPAGANCLDTISFFLSLWLSQNDSFPTFTGPHLLCRALFLSSLLPPSVEYFKSLFFFLETRHGRREGVRFFTWYGLALNCALPFLWAVEVSGGTEQGFDWAERCVTVWPSYTLSGKRLLCAWGIQTTCFTSPPWPEGRPCWAQNTFPDSHRWAVMLGYNKIQIKWEALLANGKNLPLQSLNTCLLC